MIVDAGNTFFNQQALSAADLTSDVIDYGTGEAGDPPRLVVAVHDGSDGGKVTVKVETADDEVQRRKDARHVRGRATCCCAAGRQQEIPALDRNKHVHGRHD